MNTIESTTRRFSTAYAMAHTRGLLALRLLQMPAYDRHIRRRRAINMAWERAIMQGRAAARV